MFKYRYTILDAKVRKWNDKNVVVFPKLNNNKYATLLNGSYVLSAEEYNRRVAEEKRRQAEHKELVENFDILKFLSE